MPPLLWGRAEAVRTLLRSLAMALAPLLFGAVSDHVFGGGRSGLQWTFIVMLLPLGASSWLLFKGLRTYPADVATAAASAEGAPGYPQPTDHWGLMSTGDTFLVLSAFLASGVEMVEALTIVLAAGLARGWRSSLAGLGAATLVLAVVVAALGPALTAIPLNALRLVVGALLLVFGLQWLRKAILRASGYKALHDEDAIFARELAEARGRGARRARRRRLVRVHALLQGRAARGARGRVHRAHLRQRAGLDPARGGRRRGRARARGRRRRRGARAARAGSRERDEVRGRRDAHDVRDLLVGRGRGRDWPGADAAILGVLGFVVLSSFVLVRLLRRERERLEAVQA